MSKKYIIINGVKFPNNAFFGNLYSNEFDTFQDNIWAFESRVPDWMLKQLKDNFDPSFYNQDFESFYGKWNKFDKNSQRNLIDQIIVYDDGKIDLTGDLDSAGQLDSTGAATEDPTPTILNISQTLDEEFTRLEQNEEIQNLGDLDSEGLNFQEIKDELDSLDSSFKDNLTEIMKILDGLGIKTVMNGNDIAGVNYESIVDPNSTSLEDDVKALEDKWDDIPQNDIQTFTDKLENYTSPEIPGNNLGQDLRNLQEIYAILNEQVSISDRVSEQNQIFNNFISKVELNLDLSYTNPIISSAQVGDDEIDEIGENSSVTETVEYAKRNLIDKDDTSVARLDEEGNLVGEKESFFVSNSSQSTDSGVVLNSSQSTYSSSPLFLKYIELKPELNKREITFKSESGKDNIVNITGKLTHLNYDSETNQLKYTNENGDKFVAEITGQLTSIKYREEDALWQVIAGGNSGKTKIPYKKKFLDYYGEEYSEGAIDRGDDTDPDSITFDPYNIKNPDGSWSIEIPQSFETVLSDFYFELQEINDDTSGQTQISWPWIWVSDKPHITDPNERYQVLKYYPSKEHGPVEVMNNLYSNVRLSPSPNMLIANGVRISDWVFDWDSTIDLSDLGFVQDFTINWITREEYNSKPTGGPYDLLTYPMGIRSDGGNLNGMIYFNQKTNSYDLASDVKSFNPDTFQAPLKPEYHHPTFLFRLDQVPLYKDENSYQTESGVGIFDNIFKSKGAYKNLFYEYSEKGEITPKTEEPTIDWDALYNTFLYFEVFQEDWYNEDKKEFQKRYYITGKDFRTSGEQVAVQSINPNNNEIEKQLINKQNIFGNLDSLLNTGIDEFDYTTTVQAFRTTESTNESLYPYTKMKPKGERSVSQEEFDRKIRLFEQERSREYVDINPWNGWLSAIALSSDEKDDIDLRIDKKISDFTENNLKVSKNIPEYIDKLHYPFKSLVFINEDDVPQIVKVRENLTSIFTPQKESVRRSIDLAEIEKIERDISSVNGDVSKLSKTEKFDRRYINRYNKILKNIIGVGTEDVEMRFSPDRFYKEVDDQGWSMSSTWSDFEKGLTDILNLSYYNNYQNEDDPAYSDGSWNLGKSERVMYYVNEEHQVYKINLDSSTSTTELRKTVDNDLYFIHEKVPHQEYSGLSWLFDENITTQSFEDQLNSFDWQTAAGSTDIEKQNEYKPNLVKMYTVAEDYDSTYPKFLSYKSGDLAFFRLSDAAKSLIKSDGTSNQNVENILKVCIERPGASWFNIYPSTYKLTTTEGGLVGYEEIGVIIESLVNEEEKCSITYHISENSIDKDRWKFKADETSLDISAIVIPPKNNSIDSINSLIDDRVLVKGEISRHFEITGDPLLDLSSMSVERIDFQIPSVLDFQQLNSGSLNSGNDVRCRLTLEQEVIDLNYAENFYKFLKIGWNDLKDSDYVKPSYPVKQDYRIYNNSDFEQEIDLQFRNHFIDLRTHDEDGYETGSNFKGILKDGLYDGQEIKIWITNTGNNNTYSDLEFDIKDPFIHPSELHNYYGNDDNVYDFGSFTSSDIKSKFLEQTIGERYKLPLGYMQAGRGMNNWTEDSSLGMNISARNISRFKTFFHNSESINGGSLDAKISHIQQQIEDDTRSESEQRGIKGRGLSISYRNYYKLKEVNISLSALNRFEDISLPRSLEKSVEIMKSNLSSSDIIIGRPVIKVINSLIPSHGVGDERSDFFTEFPAYEDYYYRVTEPEIVKFKVTSTSQWEQDLYELKDNEHYMHQPLRQYSQYRYMKTNDNSPDVVKKYSKSRENFRAYADISDYDIFEHDNDVSTPYNKGVWSGDYWKSHYTTFPSGVSGTHYSTKSIHGDDHVLWKYEFIGDSRQIKDHNSERIKPLSVDYFHLNGYEGGPFTDGGKPIPRPQEYPNFLNDSEKSGNDFIEEYYSHKIYNGYAAWGEDYYGTGRRTRQWGNVYHSNTKNFEESNAGKFAAARLKNESKAKYYFRRNRYSDPNFEYNTPEQIDGIYVEQSKIMSRSVNILDDFKTKYQLNLPDYASFVPLFSSRTTRTYEFRGVTTDTGTGSIDLTLNHALDWRAFRDMGGGLEDAYYIFKAITDKKGEEIREKFQDKRLLYHEIPLKNKTGSVSEFSHDDDASGFGLGEISKDGSKDKLVKFESRAGEGYRMTFTENNGKIYFTPTFRIIPFNERIIEGWGSTDGIIKVIGRPEIKLEENPKVANLYDNSVGRGGDGRYTIPKVRPPLTLNPRDRDRYDYYDPNYRVKYSYINGIELNLHVYTTTVQSVGNYIGHRNLEERYTHDIDNPPGYTLEPNNEDLDKNYKIFKNGAINSNTRLPIIAHPIWNSHSFMLSGLNLDNGYVDFDEDGERNLINANDLHILYTGKGILQSYSSSGPLEIDRYFCEGHGTYHGGRRSWYPHLEYLRKFYVGGKLNGLEQHPWVTGKGTVNPLFNNIDEKVEFFDNLAKKMNDYYSDILPSPSYCFNFYDRRYRGNSSTFDFWYNEPYYTGSAEDHGKIIDSEKYYKQNNKAHRAAIGYSNIESGFVFLDRRAESKVGSVFGRDFNFQNSKGERIINSETGIFNIDDVDSEGNRIFDQKLGDDLYAISFTRLQQLINSNKDLLEPLSEASDNPNHLKDAILFHVDDNDVIISIYKPKFTRPQSLPSGVIAPDNYILDISEFKDNLRTGDSIILHYPKKIRPENFLDYKDVEPLYRTVYEDGKIDYEEIFSRYRQGILGVNLNINYAIGRYGLPSDKKGRILFDFTNPDDEPIELDSIKSYGWYSPGQNFQGCFKKDPVFESGDHWLLGSINSDDVMWHCGLEAGFKEFVDWRIPLYIKNEELMNHVPFGDGEVVAKPDPSVKINSASVYFVLNSLNDMRTGNDYNKGNQLEDIFDNDEISLGKIIAFNNNVSIHQPLIKRPGTGIIVRTGGGEEDSPFPSNDEGISDNFYFERTRKVVPETTENEQFDEDRRTKLRKMSNWQWGLFEFENTGEWVHEELKSSDCEYYSVAKPKYIDVSPLMYKCVWSQSQAAWILQGGSHSDKFIAFNN